jgi:hypothetical protein
VNAGVKVVAGFPGIPATQIPELFTQYPHIHSPRSTSKDTGRVPSEHPETMKSPSGSGPGTCYPGAKRKSPLNGAGLSWLFLSGQGKIPRSKVTLFEPALHPPPDHCETRKSSWSVLVASSRVINSSRRPLYTGTFRSIIRWKLPPFGMEVVGDSNFRLPFEETER